MAYREYSDDDLGGLSLPELRNLRQERAGLRDQAAAFVARLDDELTRIERCIDRKSVEQR